MGNFKFQPQFGKLAPIYQMNLNTERPLIFIPFYPGRHLNKVTPSQTASVERKQQTDHGIYSVSALHNHSKKNHTICSDFNAKMKYHQCVGAKPFFAIHPQRATDKLQASISALPALGLSLHPHPTPSPLSSKHSPPSARPASTTAGAREPQERGREREGGAGHSRWRVPFRLYRDFAPMTHSPPPLL